MTRISSVGKMRLKTYCWILILLGNTWCMATRVDEVLLKKPKELLRHQQNQRPSFIDRRLIDAEKITTSSEVIVHKNPKSQDEIIDIEDDKDLRKNPSDTIPQEIKSEMNVEKAVTQIRHGRSRSHLSRQIKLDEITSPFMSNKIRQGFADNFNSPSDSISEEYRNPDESAKWNYNQNNTNTWKDQKSIVELDELLEKVSKMNSGQSGGRREGKVRESTLTRQKSGGSSLEELRKSIGKNRGRVNVNRTVGNSTETFGHVIHETWSNESVAAEEGGRQFELANLDEYEKLLENARSNNVSLVMGEGVGEGAQEGEEGLVGSFENYDQLEEENAKTDDKEPVQVDIVTRFLRIIENQHLLGENCTAGTDLNLGEGVVDQYAQERFRLEANFAVNRANMLTRLWKYAPEVMLSSEYLLHASVLSMVEFDEDIFAAGNCYDKLQYKGRWLYCPFAHRLQDQEGVLVKDLAIEYKYLSNSSEWFYIARKNAERVIASNNQFSRGFHTYTLNESMHTDREEDEILTVKYEDGRWSKPYYDCGGGNIWMLTYTVPFFGYVNDTYFFKGTSGIDIDLRRVDIDQCPLPTGSAQLNIFAASDKCKKRTTQCVAIPGLGFRRGSYRCVCKRGFYYPDTKSNSRYYNGTVIEEEYEKLMMGEESQYDVEGVFECLPCAEGCESCDDGSPCIVSLNWLMRTAILILEGCVIACLPAVALFTWKYGNVKIVRAASPVLLRVIVLGAFFIYCTTIVMYPRPNVITCTVRVWLREIGFSLTYGALMLKTWRISVIFRVKSAKAVKITDGSLLKRLGVIVMIFSVFLGIRTLVAPPVVIVARTADDLKAYLCKTDWWDHSFTALEMIFLIWGIRLCIVVRKTPSEFNESRFITMAIYNEFLLSVFLNVSMLFLQSPANPDLLYVIFFCHTQLTVTLLLCLIFGSKAYVVFRGGGKDDSMGKLSGATGKFLSKGNRPTGTSNQTNSISLQQGNFTDGESDGAMEEFRRLISQIEVLKEKNMLLGNHQLVSKLSTMQDVANRIEGSQVPTIQAISSSLRLNNLNGSSIVETNISGVYQVDREQECSNSKDKVECQSRVDKKEGQKDGEKKTNSDENKEKTKEQEEKTDVAISVLVKPKMEDIGTETSIEVLEVEKNKDTEKKEKCKSKSGHARTHAIVINLDDKTRFSEEVTV